MGDFLKACACGSLDECAQFIDGIKGPLECQDAYGRTGLILAAENGHLSIVDYLLERGADPESKDIWGYTALMKAAAHGHTRIFRCLMKKNDSLSCDTFLGTVTALTEAAAGGRNEILKLCLEHKLQLINVPVQLTGMTPLMLAIAGGHFNAVEILLENGADLSARSSLLLNAWDMASLADNDDILKLITPLLNVTPIKILITPAGDSEDDELHESGFNSTKFSLTPSSRFPTRRTPREQHFVSVAERVHRRSKSADKASRPKDKGEFNTDSIFRHILETNGLEMYWDRFREEEICLKVFFTLESNDYQSIGICDHNVVSKFLEIARHYKPLFNL